MSSGLIFSQSYKGRYGSNPIQAVYYCRDKYKTALFYTRPPPCMWVWRSVMSFNVVHVHLYTLQIFYHSQVQASPWAISELVYSNASWIREAIAVTQVNGPPDNMEFNEEVIKRS